MWVVFFGVDNRTDRVNKIYTITRDFRIFSWGYSGSDGKLEEIRGEDSEPPSPGTPERNSKGKKRKDFNEKGVDSGEENWYLHKQKWQLLRKIVIIIGGLIWCVWFISNACFCVYSFVINFKRRLLQ